MKQNRYIETRVQLLAKFICCVVSTLFKISELNKQILNAVYSYSRHEICTPKHLLLWNYVTVDWEDKYLKIVLLFTTVLSFFFQINKQHFAAFKFSKLLRHWTFSKTFCWTKVALLTLVTYFVVWYLQNAMDK